MLRCGWCGAAMLFLSTLSLRRATHSRRSQKQRHPFLSTLSLRRATREPTALRTPHHKFLSTLSLRRATFACWYIKEMTANISIHALLAESDLTDVSYLSIDNSISIHALLAESDYWPRVIVSPTLYFYPRSPCGERPLQFAVSVDRFVFLSTLSLRRATNSSVTTADKEAHFYPRSPCGERP